MKKIMTLITFSFLTYETAICAEHVNTEPVCYIPKVECRIVKIKINGTVIKHRVCTTTYVKAQ